MTVPMTPLHRAPLLLHSVQDRVKEFIRDNRLRGGDPLPPEGEFARQLGVSRNSVREAVKGLESLGVLETRRGVGVFVSDFSFGPLLSHLPFGFGNGDLRDVEEFLDIRETLEVAMMERVVPRTDDAALAGLEAIIAAMRAKAALGEGFPEEDQRFHRVLFSCLGNRVLDRLIDVFWQAFHKAAGFFDLDDHDPMETCRRHAAIVAALKQRDPVRARETMARHYKGIRSVIAAHKKKTTDQGG